MSNGARTQRDAPVLGFSSANIDSFWLPGAVWEARRLPAGPVQTLPPQEQIENLESNSQTQFYRSECLFRFLFHLNLQSYDTKYLNLTLKVSDGISFLSYI